MPGWEAFARIAGEAVVSALWQGAILAGAVWLCLRLVPRATASLRFALWAGVLLLIALLPLFETVRPDHHAPSAPSSLLQVDPRWSLALAALWLAASLLRACSLAAQGYRLWELHRSAVPLPKPLQPLSTANRRTVQLCTSAQLDRPGVIGFLAPRVLIPAWLYAQLTATELEQIVFHELEHLRRRDDWLNLLQKLSLVVFPLNPVLVLIERLLCRERELACDDGVLRRTHAPRLYATCLATLAELGLDHRPLALALGALGGRYRQSELSRRVHRILERPAAASPFHARALTALVALVLLGGGSALIRCPHLISFADRPQLTLVATHPAVALPPPPTQVLVYTGARSPRMVDASFTPARRPLVSQQNRMKPTAAHRTPIRKSRTYAGEISLVLASWTETARPQLVPFSVNPPVSEVLTAVRVEGGWLLLQL